MKNKFKIIIVVLVILLLPIMVYYGYLNYKNKGDISILAYHHFMSKEEKEKYGKNNYNIISTEKFDEQLKYLKGNDFHSVSISQLECYMKKECKLPKKAFLITIDDGNISSYYKALPILEKYNFDSVVFLIGSRTKDTTSEWTTDNFYFLGLDKLKEINEKYPKMVIGSHSYNLHDLINGKNPIDIMSEEELYNDVKKAKDMFNTSYYAYPFGRKNKLITNAVQNSGYTMAFTYKDDRQASDKDDIYSIPRIEIRGDYSLNEFKKAVNGKITFKNYLIKIKNIFKSKS